MYFNSFIFIFIYIYFSIEKILILLFLYPQYSIYVNVQVPRILAPIVKCIDRLPALTGDPAFHKYVSEEWGSIHGLRMQILSDFFKHGFDGSGIFIFL